MPKTLPTRLRAAFGALFDSTNQKEIVRRPLEIRTLGRFSEEVNSNDRAQLVSDSRKLYANLGPAKGAIDAKAMYAVGRSWLPKFEGANQAWGDRAKEWLLNEFYPLADIAGRDFQTALYLMSVSVDRDGDVGAILTEYETSFPAIQLISTTTIQNPSDDKLDKYGRLITGPYQGLRCIEGVILNDQGRPVAYYVEQEETGKEEDAELSEYITARDMTLLHEPSWVDQVRGVPGFAHAILDLKDLRTVQGYEKMASAIASSIGLLEYNETGMADMSDPTVALGGGANLQADVATKEFFGGMVRHFKAGTGAKLETFKNDRPGDAWQSFMDRLLRNAMAGINWPFELAWDMSSLGGANTRFIISTAMRSVEDRQDLLRPFARRAVGYAIAKAVKLGRLPADQDWWKWSFTMPPRLTADFGRDSNAQREDYLNGIINLTDICAERGVDLKQHIAQRTAENSALEDAGLPVPGVRGQLAPSATEPIPVPVQVPSDAAAMSAKTAKLDIPTPGIGESGNDFVNRCMNSPVMVTEFPNEGQRYAVCQAQMASVNLQVDLKPTAEMADEAARGLAWREEYGRGGTEVGVARARDISNRRNLSEQTLIRMRSYFRRHEVDKDGEGFTEGEPGYPSAGRIAWALWGGDAGYQWAERKISQIEAEG